MVVLFMTKSVRDKMNMAENVVCCLLALQNIINWLQVL